MIKYLILLFIVFGCNSPLDPLNDSECGIEIYCDLPYQNNVYSLEFNRDQIQIFKEKNDDRTNNTQIK